ncbi:MAG: lipopolysaccharide heptosyltransferase family protein [Desulfobacteraceae bacterium]|nr:MAG: lipopolysaccharide heptosyltransferase family protein [Desulfobacteraceae bacterium]
MSDDHPLDILIIKLGALGDVINTLPLAVRLKSRLQAKIHWLVAPLSYPIMSRHPAVDHTILFDKTNWKSSLPDVKRQIRSRRFDLVLDLQRILKSGALCMFANGRRRIGFDRKRCKEMTWLFPFERIPAADPSSHMLLQYLEFADYLGIRETRVEWGLSGSLVRPAFLPAPYVVLNIGATKPANKWTIPGFSSLAEQIESRFRLSCVMTGGREDMEMARQIEDRSAAGLTNLAGRTTLDELKDVLQHAEAVITCDTGPMHLAVALGKKVVALFGPSDHQRTGPFRGHVIRKAVHCAPCNRKTCENPICMNRITPEDVMKHLTLVLDHITVREGL